MASSLAISSLMASFLMVLATSLAAAFVCSASQAELCGYPCGICDQAVGQGPGVQGPGTGSSGSLACCWVSSSRPGGHRADLVNSSSSASSSSVWPSSHSKVGSLLRTPPQVELPCVIRSIGLWSSSISSNFMIWYVIGSLSQPRSCVRRPP